MKPCQARSHGIPQKLDLRRVGGGVGLENGVSDFVQQNQANFSSRRRVCVRFPGLMIFIPIDALIQPATSRLREGISQPLKTRT